MFKFELLFTIKPEQFNEWGEAPLMRYSASIQGYDSDGCEGDSLFMREATHSAQFNNCNKPNNQCDPIFIIQESHFVNSDFKINLVSEKTPNYQEKVFSKIEIMTTTRHYNYVSVLVFLKFLFTIGTAACIFFFVKRVSQFNITDVGIIQKKLLMVLLFLFLFNDPLFFFHALFPYKIVSIVNTVVQASFIALLLHFWSFLIDSISEEDMIRENPIRFYGPKLLLVVLIWLFLLVTLSMVRIQEAADPMFYANMDINQTSVKTLSWILFFLLVLYGLYLVAITLKACTAIQRMKENYRFIISLTLTVIATCLFFLGFMGLQKYVSTATSITKVVSIEALLNLYVYIIVYLYSPCEMGSTQIRNQRDRDHWQIK